MKEFKCPVTVLIYNLIEELKNPARPSKEVRCVWDVEREG